MTKIQMIIKTNNLKYIVMEFNHKINKNFSLKTKILYKQI